MNEAEYRLKIADLCSHAGIAEWEEVARTQHIEVAGKTIGLIPDPGGRLSVYIDLGPVYIERDPWIFEQMLIANMEPRGSLSGAFCIYPDSGNAVYHMTLPAEVTGQESARRLASAIEQAGARFNALVQATT